MNATRKTMVPLAVLVLLVGTGCSDPGGSSQTPMSDVPLVTAPAAQEYQPTPPVETHVGGVPSTYTAYYKGSELRRIAEQRAADELRKTGEYEFQGARLLRYRGAPLEGDGVLLLELDLHGAVTSAQKDGQPASEHEVSAIRDRASLLRSHALAQHAMNAHTTY